LNHVGTPHEIPHEISDSVELADNWLRFVEHQKKAGDITHELKENQMLQKKRGAVKNLREKRFISEQSDHKEDFLHNHQVPGWFLRLLHMIILLIIY